MTPENTSIEANPNSLESLRSALAVVEKSVDLGGLLLDEVIRRLPPGDAAQLSCIKN